MTKNHRNRLIDMKNGHSQSCGCLRFGYEPSWQLNLTNRKFDKLTAIKVVGNDHNRRKLWLCHCECGNKKIVNTNRLMTGDTGSCGDCRIF